MGHRMVGTWCLGVVLTGIAPGAAPALTKEEIVGTWKLVSNVREDINTGKKADNLGPNPIGHLIVTPDNRFMIVQVAQDRKASSTLEGQAALYKSMLAYSGTITLSPDPQGLKMVNKVDISWNDAWTGTEQVRYLSMDGPRLVIKTAPIKNPFHEGEVTVSTLVWERSK